MSDQPNISRYQEIQRGIDQFITDPCRTTHEFWYKEFTVRTNDVCGNHQAIYLAILKISKVIGYRDYPE